VIRALHFSVSTDAGLVLVPPVSFECPDDRLFVSGASGAGKTTLLESMARVSPHKAAGHMELSGAAVLAVQDAQAAFSPYRQLRGQLADARRFCPRAEWNEALESNLGALGLTSGVLYLYPHQLSAGMLKRVLLAAVLAAKAPLALLDEPTAGLDPSVRWRAIELVRTTASAYVIATHDAELLGSARIECRLHLGPGEVRRFGPAEGFSEMDLGEADGEDTTPQVGPDGVEK